MKRKSNQTFTKNKWNTNCVCVYMFTRKKHDIHVGIVFCLSESMINMIFLSIQLMNNKCSVIITL